MDIFQVVKPLVYYFMLEYTSRRWANRNKHKSSTQSSILHTPLCLRGDDDAGVAQPLEPHLTRPLNLRRRCSANQKAATMQFAHLIGTEVQVSRAGACNHFDASGIRLVGLTSSLLGKAATSLATHHSCRQNIVRSLFRHRCHLHLTYTVPPTNPLP
jgi:hypothetical protein